MNKNEYINNVFLNNSLNELKIDLVILRKLNDNNIYTIIDLWNLKRKDLKKFNLNDNQIKQVSIKMQLYGLDLNKRIYKKD